MSNTNKKLLLEGNGIFSLIKNEFNFGPIQNNQVRVKPINVGICSSDIPRCFDNKAYFYPLVIGHEFQVEVIEDPSNTFQKGDFCAVFPLRPCFNCNSCETLQYNKCKNYSYYGSRVDGGLQSYLDIDKWNLIYLPKNIDNISGGLLEPIAVCMHAAKIIKNPKKILLFGGGFLAQILSQMFALKSLYVTCLDRNEYKKEFFPKDVDFFTSSSQLEESSFDLAFDCCGSPNALEEIIRLTKPNGEIIQMANPSINLNLSANLISSFMRKEQKLIGTWNSDYRPDNKSICDWQQSITLLAEEKINIRKLISHTTNIDESYKLIEKINLRREDKKALPNFNKAVIRVS